MLNATGIHRRARCWRQRCYLERSHRGRVRRFAKAVRVTPSWVRLPPSPLLESWPSGKALVLKTSKG